MIGAVCVTASPAAVADAPRIASAVIECPSRLSGAERTLCETLFSSQGEWAPSGQVVADSGFRPSPDGFSFMNYGGSLYLNQRLFQQPKPVAPGAAPVKRARLLPRDLRLIFGDSVCVTGTATSTTSNCVLTESADQVRKDAYAWGKAGHCLGLASESAALFTGLLPRENIGAATPTGGTPLSRTIQRAFERHVVAGHFGLSAVPLADASAVVGTLRESLAPGQLPYLLILSGEPGGHAMVPFAVLEQPDGSAEIAVYDPNFPKRARAVKIDMRTGQWRYQGAAIPSASSLLWDSANSSVQTQMYLVPVNEVFNVQSCPFCTQIDERTVVIFSAVLRENSGVFESLTLRNPDGTPLDPSLYEIVAPVQGLGDWVGGPTIKVSPGVDFGLNLVAAGIVVPQEFTISVYRAGFVQSVRFQDLKPEVAGVIEVGGRTAKLHVRMVVPQEIRLRQTVEDSNASYRFTATRVGRGPRAELDLKVVKQRKQIVLQGSTRSATVIKLDLRSVNAEGVGHFRIPQVQVPPGSRLLATYGSWAGAEGKPRVWIDADADGTPDIEVPLKLVA